MKLYALHDRKAGALSSFHVSGNDAEASRGFQDAVNAPNSVIGRYAEDFELVALAQLEPDTTKETEPVDPYVGLHVVLTAAQVVAMRPAAPQQLELLKEA